MKKLLAILLIFCMVFTMIPLTASAAGEIASGTCGDNLTWVLTEDGTLTISGTGAVCSGAWNDYLDHIQYAIMEDGVTAIDTDAFKDCSSLLGVTIPDSVAFIGFSSFQNCTSLTEISIPNSVEGIGAYAFWNCSSLTDICLPNGLTFIQDRTFYGCSSLNTISIPDSVTSIDYGTFYGCSSLSTIEIPSRIESIGNFCFAGCTALTNIEFTGGPAEIAENAFSEVEANAYYSLSNSGWSESYMQNYGGKLTWIASECKGGHDMLDDVCQRCGISTGGDEEDPDDGGTGEVDPGEGGSSEGGSGEGGSGDGGSGEGGSNGDNVAEDLTWTLENGTLTISGHGAMPNYFNYWESPWYEVRDQITAVVINPGITSIGHSAFSSCSNLKTATIPESVTSIECYAFSGAALTVIFLPASLEKIAGGAFAACDQIIKITVEEKNPYFTVIDDVLFNQDQTTLVLYPAGSSAISYAIPDTVSALEDYAFSAAGNLQEILIPNTVTDLGTDTFYKCTGLKSLTIPGTVATIRRGAFDTCPNLTEVTISEGVTHIDMAAFFGCSSLEQIKLPSTLTYIGIQAFQESGLREVIIPDSVATIERYAFCDCDSLEKVYIGSNAEFIGEGVFDACDQLSTLDIAAENSHFSSLDNVLFNKDLTHLIHYPMGKKNDQYTIPDTVTEIGNRAFICNPHLSYVQLPEGLTTIGQAAFQQCTSLKEIAIPDRVTTVSIHAFYGCTSLKTAILHDGITIIDKGAFSECESLSEIHWPQSLQTIGLIVTSNYLPQRTV